MAGEKSTWEQLLAQRAEWAEQQPSLGAELKAMGREAVKDIRGTVHQSFFGQPEHAAEMGTPLNPTPQMTTQDLGTIHGSYQASNRSRVEHAKNTGKTAPRTNKTALLATFYSTGQVW